jgi:hypothetical protein
MKLALWSWKVTWFNHGGKCGRNYQNDNHTALWIQQSVLLQRIYPADKLSIGQVKRYPPKTCLYSKGPGPLHLHQHRDR